MRSRRVLLPYVLAVLLLLGLSACGVGATDHSVDEGDAATGGSGLDTEPKTPPVPQDALSADDQIRNFLQAAVGGLSVANDNMKKFLTPKALTQWVDPVPAENPPLLVVRIVGGPTIGSPVGQRTPVTLDYQVIGTMTDQGRIDDLAPVATRSITFWMVADPEGPVLIDQINDWPGGLVISDEGLHNYYQMQPIYFWDMEYKLLVPDLRYMPLTKKPDQRARTILDWLGAGPSPWLGGVWRLPIGSAVENVFSDADGTLKVDLSAAAAGTGDSDALKRLMYQLQWSLSSVTGGDAPPRIELRLDEIATPVDALETEFRRYNHGRAYSDSDPLTYDIAQGTVVATNGTASPALTVPENNSVVHAAIRSDGVGAFIRAGTSGRRSLQIVRAGAAAITAQVPTGFTIGRPSFVPETDFVVVSTGGSAGRLYAVSTVDGTADEATHSLTGVSSVSVSPDGRRVAVVADGEVFVSSLVVANNQITLASTQRQVLAGRLTARAVTWTSEAWLLVAGTSGPTQALWRVSSDGVLAEDLSGSLGGLSVEDLVCYPRWTGAPSWNSRWGVAALATTSSGIYTFRSKFDPAGFASPFFTT